MSTPSKIIRQQVKVLEEAAAPIAAVRSRAKKDTGRLTDFGKDLLRTGKKHGIPQAEMARLLGITPAGVTPYYK
jgi:hypothetical protein